MTTRRVASLAFAVLCALTLGARSALAEQTARPGNRTALIIDLSGTFRNRVAKAVQQAQSLLAAMGEIQLKRYERDRDKVTLVALDAFPEVIWEGGLSDLGGLTPERLAELVAARADYRHCTDVARSFSVAADALGSDPASVRYFFVFSDLIDEPATDTLAKCQSVKRPSPPPAEMPWDRMEGASVSVFWVPAVQKLVWQREVEALGLAKSFRVFTESESVSPTLVPPPRPTIAVNEEERSEARSAVWGWVKALIVAAGILMGSAVVGVIVLARITRGRRKKADFGLKRVSVRR